MFKIHKEELEVNGKKLTLETGKIARQADGAIIATLGETVVIATAVGAKKIAEGQGDSRNYFENILDVNYFFNNGLYLFTQLEFSNPPLLGLETKKISDMKILPIKSNIFSILKLNNYPHLLQRTVANISSHSSSFSST